MKMVKRKECTKRFKHRQEQAINVATCRAWVCPSCLKPEDVIDYSFVGEFRCQSQFWDGNPLWVFYNQVQRAQPLCATMGAQCARGCRCDCERVLTKRGHGRQDPSTGTSAVHQSFFGRLEGRKTLSKPPLVHLYPSSDHLEIISSGTFLTGLTVSVYGASPCTPLAWPAWLVSTPRSMHAFHLLRLRHGLPCCRSLGDTMHWGWEIFMVSWWWWIDPM